MFIYLYAYTYIYIDVYIVVQCITAIYHSYIIWKRKACEVKVINSNNSKLLALSSMIII